jgi:hypothetical protein
MFGLAILLIVNIGLSAISAILKNRTTKPEDFKGPTAEEGRAIPVIFGTVKVQPQVNWWGDVSVDGNKYYAGMWFTLCHGQIDELVAITAAEAKDVPFTAAAPTMGPDGEDFIQITIDEEELFGGEDFEGGLKGFIDLYRGGQGHEPNEYLAGASALGVTPPSYRGISHAVLAAPGGFYFGTTPYIKPLSFVLRRLPDPFSEPTLKDIDGNANPAFIIAEILTNKVWGLGIAIERLDEANFVEQAQTLFDEGFGLSVQLDNDVQADDLITNILRHIDAAIYVDPSTGLWTLTLIRADYDSEDLPLFTDADVVEGTLSYNRGSWEETVNHVTVTFTGEDFRDRVVQSQDSANFTTRGEISPNAINFPWIHDVTTGQRVVSRELRAHALPWAKLEMTTNRRAFQLRMGSPFRFSSEAEGIPEKVFRVATIDYGTLERGQIRITAVEDVFGAGFIPFVDPGDSLWEEPVPPPEEARAILMEAPYQLQHDDLIRVLVHVSREDTTSNKFEVWVKDFGVSDFYKTKTIVGFTPTGLLSADYGACTDALDATGFTVAFESDLFLLASCTATERDLGKNLLLVDNEIMAWQTVVNNLNGTYTFTNLVRGVYDTVPAAHAEGARVWFISKAYDEETVPPNTIKNTPYTEDETVDVKPLPVNLSGQVVPIGDVTEVTIETDSRAQKPYPPGNVEVNGETCPTEIFEDAELTWAHRTRLMPDRVVIHQDAVIAVTPEGTYTVQAIIDGDVVREWTGLTGTSQTYTLDEREADDPDLDKPTTLRIIPVNGGLEGTVRDKAFVMRRTGPAAIVTEGFYFPRRFVVTDGFLD